MNDRGFPRLVLALVLTAFLLYAVADANVLVLLPGIPLAILGWFLSRSRERPLHKVILTTLVFGAVANAGVGILRDGLDVTDFCEFVVLIQLIKLFDKRTARDYSQLITLSTFLAIGSVLTSSDIAPGMILLVFIPLLIVTAMRFQFYAGREHDIDHAKSLGAEPMPVRLRVRGLGSLALLTLMSSTAISAVVFVLVPRGLGADTFGNWTRAASGTRTGFTDTVRLGGEGLISESQQIVLDVSIKDPDGNVVGGPHEVFYLRGAVLEHYENGRWEHRSDATQKRQEIVPGDTMPFGSAGGEKVDIIQTITIRDMPGVQERAYLFAAWKLTRIKFEQACLIDYDPFARTFQRRGEPGKFQYTVESIRQHRIPDANFPAHEDEISFPSEPIRTLASQVLHNVGIGQDQLSVEGERLALAARTIENFLRTDFQYSLEMRRPLDNTDPIEWFLFESKIGHCEYFASAMVAMCQSVGVNARIVTGYVAAEWIPESNHYLVRESNAHAWVEVEVKPKIWRTYDPTPPGDLMDNHQPKNSLISRVSHIINALEYLWIRSVVGFDEKTRVSLLGGRNRDGTGAIRNEQGASRPALLITPRTLGSALSNAGIGFAITLAVGGLALIAIRLGRGSPTGDWWTGTDAELRRSQARFFVDLQRELSRLGFPRLNSTPPLAHIQHAIALGSPVRDPATRLTGHYYQLRFAARMLTSEQQREIRTDLETLRSLPRTRPANRAVRE